MVRVIDEKTQTEGWRPLFDDAGVALHPELMAAHRRPDAVPRLGQPRAVADMAEARSTGLHAHVAQGERGHPRRWLAR